MKPRTLLILFLLVAGLGAYVWFVERKLPSSSERAERAKKVLDFEVNDVEAVTLESGGKKVRLERQKSPAEAGKKSEEAPLGETWRLVEPISAAADGGQVRMLLGTLSNLEAERSIEDFDRKQLGLDTPRARVSLRTAKGETTLEVGADLPSSTSTLAAVAGGKVAVVVPASFMTEVAKEAGEWRDRTLFHGDRSKIASIALTHAGGQRVLLARRGESFWLEAPVSDRADRDLVDRLLSALQGLAAKKFLEGSAADPAATGLASPSATLEVVVTGEAAPFKLELGKPESEGSLSHYARVGTEILTTDADLAAHLERAPEAWRSLAWAGMATWEVDRFEVSDAKGKLVLERAEGDWKRDGTAIPYSPVGDLLAAITEVKGDKLVDSAPAGAVRVTLKLAGKEGHEETLTLLAPAGGELAAKSSERTAALLVPEAKLTDLEAKIEAVRAAQPLPKPEPKPGEAKVETEEGK